MRLKDRVAIVTGAGQGIGEAAASTRASASWTSSTWMPMWMRLPFVGCTGSMGWTGSRNSNSSTQPSAKPTMHTRKLTPGGPSMTTSAKSPAMVNGLAIQWPSKASM